MNKNTLCFVVKPSRPLRVLSVLCDTKIDVTEERKERKVDAKNAKKKKYNNASIKRPAYRTL